MRRSSRSQISSDSSATAAAAAAASSSSSTGGSRVAGTKRARQEVKKIKSDPTNEADTKQSNDHKRVKKTAVKSESMKAEPAADNDEPMAAADGDDAEESNEMKEDNGRELTVAELAEQQGISVYEYSRRENIRLKNEQLQLLNLAGMSADLGMKKAPPAKRSTSTSKKKKAVPVEFLRRSTRSSGAPVPVYVPDASFAEWAPRPSRREGPVPAAECFVSSGYAAAGKGEKEEEEEDEDEADGKGESKEGEDAEKARKKAEEELARNKTWQSVWKVARDAPLLSSKIEEQARAAVEKSYGSAKAISQASIRMKGEGIKVLKSRSTTIKYHPTASLNSNQSLLAAADKTGNVSIVSFVNQAATPAAWTESIQFTEFSPHVTSVVELSWSALERQSLYSASREGSVRRFDVERACFDEFWVEDENDGDGLSCMTMAPDQSTVYVGDRSGRLFVLDARADSSSSSSSSSSAAAAAASTRRKGKSSSHFQLSEKALNGLTFNPRNSHLFVSAGKDRLVRAWDMRKITPDKPLAEWEHGYSINSVYFSPSGNQLASTSYDDTIKLWTCVNSSGDLLSPTQWAKPAIIKHDNHTGRWVTMFRAVFAPRDAALAIGNMKRYIDLFPLAAPAAPVGPASAAASSSSTPAKKKGAAVAGGGGDLSTSGPGVNPTLPHMFSVSHAEWVTSIPAAVAWHPTQVQVAGCTGSGRLYVFGN